VALGLTQPLTEIYNHFLLWDSVSTTIQINSTGYSNMLRLIKSSSGYAKNREVFYNVAVRIWDLRWLTISAAIGSMCVY